MKPVSQVPVEIENIEPVTLPASVVVMPTKPVPPPATLWDGKIATLNGVELNLAELRDVLIGLRDTIYCPDCRCPNWLGDQQGKVVHFNGCKLGKFTATIVQIVPKEGSTVRWKNG